MRTSCSRVMWIQQNLCAKRDLLGTIPGYYSMPDFYPVFHLTAVTHRNDAVYPATIVGIPPMEDFYIGGA